MLNKLRKHFELTILLYNKALGFEILSNFCIQNFLEAFRSGNFIYIKDVDFEIISNFYIDYFFI